MSKRPVAEALGTFILMCFGCGSAVFISDLIGMHGIAMAYGLAIAAAAAILVIASGKADHALATGGLGQNGFAPGYLGEYTILAAFVFEAVATVLFVTVILGATGPGAAAGFAGLAIGLTLAAIHLVGINITGVSVNPARPISPAVLAGGEALADLWLFVVAPRLSGAVTGALHSMGLTRADA